MDERQPIDDLFARGLREAEEAPPEAVWAGIVRERGWAHQTLLRLRRRWGLASLLLLLGSTAAYWGMRTVDTDRAYAEIAEAPVGAHSAVLVHTVAQRSTTLPAVGGTANLHPDVPVGEGSTGAAMPTVANGAGQTAATPPTMALPATPDAQDRSPGTGGAHNAPTPEKRSSGPVGQEASSAQPLRGGIEATEPNEEGGNGHSLANNPQEVDLALSAGVGSATGIAEEPKAEFAATSLVQQRSRAQFLNVRSPRAEPARLVPAPNRVGGTTFAGPRRGWWVAATLAQYRESRTWQGPEEDLVQALQSTELPHHPVGIGAMAGVGLRGGWGISAGVEYNAVRYEYRHLDRFVLRTDTLVPFMLTFNDQVLESYSDTLTTYTEERREVAAVNRYTTFRVPIEGSWHRGWHRWRLGLRAGVAVEYNKQLAGVTLIDQGGGAQSVEVGSAQAERTSMLLSGSASADIGFGITERISLWASPTIGIGVLPLAVGKDNPYAMPGRTGIRLRLAYTFRPGT